MARTEGGERRTTGSGAAIATLAFAMLGAVAWAAHFTALYGAQSLLCATLGDTETVWVVIDTVIVSATLVTLALVALSTMREGAIMDRLGAASWSGATRDFIRYTHVAIALLGGWAIVATAAVRLLLPACAVLR